MAFNIKHIILLGCIGISPIILGTATLYAADAPRAQQATFNRLIHALRVDDRAAFLSNATDEMKKGMTIQLMDKVSHAIAPHLNSGFHASFLGDLNQKGCRVELWKMTFKDGHDDALIRVVIGGDKLAGFFIQ